MGEEVEWGGRGGGRHLGLKGGCESEGMDVSVGVHVGVSVRGYWSETVRGSCISCMEMLLCCGQRGWGSILFYLLL